MIACFADATEPSLRAALGWRGADDVVWDPRGFTVRCTPTRWTRCLQFVHDGRARRVFCKHRVGGVRAAEAEWYWLHALPRAGFRCAQPVCFARCGERTTVVTAAATGRSLAALLLEADVAAAVLYATSTVAPMLRRLHDAGLVFRDAYWQHLFAETLAPGHEPTWIDVERVKRPLWRHARWHVKDLAGMVASWPLAVPMGEAFVHAYGGGVARGLLARVMRKAERIRAHTPKFGN